MTDAQYRARHFEKRSKVNMATPKHKVTRDVEQGYLVVYSKDTADHYESWSPKKAFEEGYMSAQEYIAEVDNHARALAIGSFGWAIERLKAGGKVCRRGWNGKGMWLILTPGRVVENLEPNSFYDKCGFEAPVTICSHIDMKAADGSMVVGWLASQTDMLADDWEEVE
jgi:hypothetical protein